MNYLPFGSQFVFTIVRLRPVQAGFCAHTPGGYWIFDYWIFQHDPPDDGGDGGGEVETKSPPGSRPSPAPAPRDKISRSGVPHSDFVPGCGSWSGPGPWRRLSLVVAATAVAVTQGVGGHAGKSNNRKSNNSPGVWVDTQKPA